jgi:opacity protein-like surface antigen
MGGVGLSNTTHRLFLSNVLVDDVKEGNVGIYAQNTIRWTDWFRTTAGLRGDYFWASVNSTLQPANSGNPDAAIGSPKFTMTFGPFYKTELFLGAGMGYHSNDARGVTATQVAGDPATPQDTTPFLVRSRGAEIGIRTKAIPNLDSSISLFYLHQDSELVFEGDTGTTAPGPPSLRTGIEITNKYRPVSWVSVDADVALSRARLIGFDLAQEQLYESLAGFPQAQIGNAPGNFVPEAPWMVASAAANQSTVFDSETLRGRLGYAFDNVLLYGTAGWAWSSNQYVRTQLTGTLNNATAGADEAVNKYLSGWTAGAGISVAFAQNWNVFAEYRYTSFGSTTFALPLSQLSTTSTTKISAIDFGVNYKFSANGPGGPALTAADAELPAATIAPHYKALHGRSPYPWTGFYFGADGGYGWQRSTGTLTTAAEAVLTPYDYRATGPFAGVFVGGNYQFNWLVLGVEGDWQWSNLTGNSQSLAPLGATGALPAGPFTVSTTTKDYGSIRGRLGFAFDRFLVFGTAGWASGDPSIAFALTGAAPFVTTGGKSSGWSAGAGVDYAITDTVLGRVEYRYTNLETLGFVNSSTNSADTGTRAPISDFRVGIAYKLGS